MTVVLAGSDLSLDELVRVARAGEPVELASAAVERMRATRAVVEAASIGGQEVYGLTTGVGAKKKAAVAPGDVAEFNRLLVLNHRVGQGPALPDDVVRAALCRLANGLASGEPGVRPELAQALVDALNDGVRPVVRRLGSIGVADLSANADLAHGALAGFPLAAGEALALLCHSAVSTGHAALALADATALLDALDVAGALDLEAFAANPGALDPAVGDARPYPGIRTSLERLSRLLEGSHLGDDGAARNLQDPLCFRCLPQVHGAARDALAFASGQLAVELNAAQGNPLVAGSRILAVGNFDALPLAAALDLARIALAPALASACERSLKLLQRPLSGLPEGLAVQEGIAEDGLAEFGIAMQAIVAEARLLAQPVSFELVSTTQAEGIEDRTTLAPLAARRTAELVELGARAVAIELVVAAQAVDLRGARPLGKGTVRAYEAVRGLVPPLRGGEPIPQDLEPVAALVLGLGR
ncbi:MAG TPA: aromatic amino acid lyase [Gaiellaceae bacterium]|nr:aromatic amino acid lyase [Gaiellaceae bacterium]